MYGWLGPSCGLWTNLFAMCPSRSWCNSEPGSHWLSILSSHVAWNLNVLHVYTYPGWSWDDQSIGDPSTIRIRSMSSPPPVDDRTVYLGKDFIWTWYRSHSRMEEATLSISQADRGMRNIWARYQAIRFYIAQEAYVWHARTSHESF